MQGKQHYTVTDLRSGSDHRHLGTSIWCRIDEPLRTAETLWCIRLRDPRVCPPLGIS